MVDAPPSSVPNRTKRRSLLGILELWLRKRSLYVFVCLGHKMYQPRSWWRSRGNLPVEGEGWKQLSFGEEGPRNFGTLILVAPGASSLCLDSGNQPYVLRMHSPFHLNRFKWTFCPLQPGDPSNTEWQSEWAGKWDHFHTQGHNPRVWRYSFQLVSVMRETSTLVSSEHVKANSFHLKKERILTSSGQLEKLVYQHIQSQGIFW